MEFLFTWKSKLFSNKYVIYQNEVLIGEIISKTWSRKALGELKGRKLMFETKGFFTQETRIFDQKDESVIVEIFFNTWKTKTTIRYINKEYQWRSDNFWNTKWSISNENGVLINYHSKNTRGNIISYTDDEVLILTGLFIKNYFQQNAAIAAAAS